MKYIKKQILKHTKNFKGPPPKKKKSFVQKIFPEWFGHKTIDFFFFKIFVFIQCKLMLSNKYCLWTPFLAKCSECDIHTSPALAAGFYFEFPIFKSWFVSTDHKVSSSIQTSRQFEQFPYTGSLYIRIKLPHQSLLGHPVREATTGVSVCSIGGRPFPIQLHQ